MVTLNAYSRLDRLLHRIAFANSSVQIVAAEIEDSLFRRDLKAVDLGGPIFITSLPRAGTTILLAALNSVPELATHLYRDMPFVMAPLLWSRLSGRFHKQAMLQERAHGDGIAIGYDSPEAFEEVIWRAFWPGHFKPDGIALWSANDANSEARDFMTRHFQKIVALRCERDAGPGRYISKNNANIARLDLIPEMFPDAAVLVPIRSPLAHAASLQRQHANFLERHAEDAFTLRYMGDIGHYEFGDLHRPIQFEGFAALVEGLKVTDLDYWFAYWIAAFEHIAARRNRIHLIEYEDLCRRGREAAVYLCELLGIEGSRASEIGAHFRPVPPTKPEFEAFRSPLRDRAEALHRELISG
jgi:hypothetical protein